MFYKTAKLRNMLNRLEKRAFAARAGVNLVKALLGSGAQTGIKAIPKTLGAVAPKIEGALGAVAPKIEGALGGATGKLSRSELMRQELYGTPAQRLEQVYNKPFHEAFPFHQDFGKQGHDHRFREKRAIAALIGPLFRAASRAPLTTAAVGLGGMAGYEFARQPKKLANPALLPNASTVPPQNNDAALQKTSLDRQILGALLRR
jgi:hypothetical protein